MADAFRAISNIEHGEEKVLENGDIANVVTKFPYGSVVAGLSNEVMAELWRAGVLEKIEVVPEPTVTKTVTTTQVTPNSTPAAPDANSSETPPAS